MTNYLVQRFLWFRERGFVQITQKTLVSLFPFFLFSGIIRVISLSVFSELGYINQLFSVSDWLPAFKITGQDRKSTRLNSSHIQKSRMPSSA